MKRPEDWWRWTAEEKRRWNRELQEQREAACAKHRFSRSHWAGILGWRYYCTHCGAYYNAYEHTEGDGCEHPPDDPPLGHLLEARRSEDRSNDPAPDQDGSGER